MYLGDGQFRNCYEGTYVGGNRNQQAAACKCFKDKYSVLESEFFEMDDKIVKKTIRFAEEWNNFCPVGREILVSDGYTVQHGYTGKKYQVEPLIRYFTKFTSNNGWINKDTGHAGLYMEAFTHFTYHASGGQMIVCDLQGRYRDNSRYSNSSKSRFELTDPAICSRRRNYGPTDLGEKGIESFFHNHVCNQYCEDHWQAPRYERNWFANSSTTTMVRSSMSNYLTVANNARFTATLQPIYGNNNYSECNADNNYYSDSDSDSW
eukprot:jgi/Psemu1/301322/fgenesh1_kg.30_\